MQASTKCEAGEHLITNFPPIRQLGLLPPFQPMEAPELP